MEIESKEVSKLNESLNFLNEINIFTNKLNNHPSIEKIKCDDIENVKGLKNYIKSNLKIINKKYKKLKKQKIDLSIHDKQIAQINFTLGKCYYRQGMDIQNEYNKDQKFTKATKYFEKSKPHFIKNGTFEYFEYLALSYFHRTKFQKAKESLEKYNTCEIIDNNKKQIYNTKRYNQIMGYIYFNMEKYEESIECLKSLFNTELTNIPEKSICKIISIIKRAEELQIKKEEERERRKNMRNIVKKEINFVSFIFKSEKERIKKYLARKSNKENNANYQRL